MSFYKHDSSVTKVFRAKRISFAAWLVYVGLKETAKGNGIVEISTKEIAENMGMGKRNVRYGIKELRNLGLKLPKTSEEKIYII